MYALALAAALATVSAATPREALPKPTRLPVAVGSELKQLVLLDQRGERWTIDTEGDAPVVVVMGSQRELGQMKEWTRHLEIGGADARIVRVLDASNESPRWKRAVTKALKDASPHAIDMDGSIARQLGRLSGKAIVVTIHHGRVTAIADGPIATREYAAVLDGIDR